MPPHSPGEPAPRDTVAIGGSAGSLEPMRAIVRAFPKDFGGTIFIVAHVGRSCSILPQLLRGVGRLTASHPRDGEPIRPGHVYVAPPDHHLLVEEQRARLSRGPPEHFTRPAIDPLFRSAAASRGGRVIGVVLSGRGSDGAAGLHRIQQAGGLAVVEDPAEAPFSDMPRAAMSLLEPDHVAATAELPELLLRLSREPATRAPVGTSKEIHTAMQELSRPLTFACPDCGGALRLVPETGMQEYACHVGHRFGAAELVEAQFAGVENGITIALRMLNEQAEFARRVIENARDAPFDNAIVYWQRLQVQAEEQAAQLRRFLEGRPSPGGESETKNAA